MEIPKFVPRPVERFLTRRRRTKEAFSLVRQARTARGNEEVQIQVLERAISLTARDRGRNVNRVNALAHELAGDLLLAENPRAARRHYEASLWSQLRAYQNTEEFLRKGRRTRDKLHPLIFP